MVNSKKTVNKDKAFDSNLHTAVSNVQEVNDLVYSHKPQESIFVFKSLIVHRI